MRKNLYYLHVQFKTFCTYEQINISFESFIYIDVNWVQHPSLSNNKNPSLMTVLLYYVNKCILV